MDRRQFLATGAAVGTAAMVPRSFVRTLEDRDLFNAVIHLYDGDEWILSTPTSLERERKGTDVVYGKGYDLVVTAERTFSFNRVGVEIEGIPKEILLPISKRYTVTRGNTLTLLADAKGLVRVEGMI